MNHNNIENMLRQINIDMTYLTLKAGIISALWICVIMAVSIDLYHGIKKSKERGEFKNSFGLRRTVDKAISYLSFMLFMVIGDVVISLATSSVLPFGFAVLPLFNLGGAGVLVYNEWVSVREKADQKMMVRINKSSAELQRMMFEMMMVYKANPKVMEDILNRFDQDKKESINQ